MIVSLTAPAGLRPQVEARIEQLQDRVQTLIALLDTLDGDCDLEDNGDFEPSLGSQSVMLPTGEIIEDGEYDEAP